MVEKMMVIIDLSGMDYISFSDYLPSYTVRQPTQGLSIIQIIWTELLRSVQQMGLPTSDEEKKMEVRPLVNSLVVNWMLINIIQALEHFKKAHPELDFSKAKIS